MLMMDNLSSEESHSPISELEKQVTKLLEKYEQMEKENQLLREEQHKLSSRNSQLLQNNDEVKDRIESLLKRLSILEGQSS